MRLPRFIRSPLPAGYISCAYYGRFAMSLTPNQSASPPSQALNTATVSTTPMTTTAATDVKPVIPTTTNATNVVATVTMNGSTVLSREVVARTSVTLCRWALVILIQRRSSPGSP